MSRFPCLLPVHDAIRQRCSEIRAAREITSWEATCQARPKPGRCRSVGAHTGTHRAGYHETGQAHVVIRLDTHACFERPRRSSSSGRSVGVLARTTGVDVSTIRRRRNASPTEGLEMEDPQPPTGVLGGLPGLLTGRVDPVVRIALIRCNETARLCERPGEGSSSAGPRIRGARRSVSMRCQRRLRPGHHKA